MTVNGGILTITGDANGTTGGMAWRQGRSKYGRWEARIKSPVADPSYHAVMLLWPDAENWPVGGEVDFMEISDATRQKADFFLHYGEQNHQLHGQLHRGRGVLGASHRRRARVGTARLGRDRRL